MKNKNLQLIIIIAVIIIGISIFTFFTDTSENFSKNQTQNQIIEKTNVSLQNPLQRAITMEAEDNVLHYKEELFWDGDYFSILVNNKTEYQQNFISKFNKRYNVEANNFQVGFNEEKNLTVLKCDVHGKQYAENSYEFQWFIHPLFLDPYEYDIYDFNFYDFNESERKLRWEGTINNTKTAVTLSFPFPVSHCKAHVWPK